MDDCKKNEIKKRSLLSRVVGVIGSLAMYTSIAIIVASLASVAIGGSTAVRIFGYSPYFIETFSMQSVMPAGSIVIAKHNDQNTYEIGDDISFYDISKDGKVVTHRIIDIESDTQGRFYVTKGVNNDEPDDQTVFEENVIGKIVLVIPELGIYISYIKDNLVLVLGFTIGGWYVLKMIKNLLLDDKKEEKSRDDPEEVSQCEVDPKK